MNARTVLRLRRRLGLALLAALCAAPVAPVRADDALVRLRATGSVRVGITQASPPWTFLDGDNRPSGYDVAVAREVAKRIGAPDVVFVADQFRNFIEGLRTNKYDLVMNDLTPTPERETQVDFAAPYGVEDFRIFTRAGDTSIRSLADLAGRNVGVTTGTTNETWTRANLQKSAVLGYANGSLVFQDLGAGRVDAVIISHFGGLRYATANKLPVQEVGAPLAFMVMAPAMAKDQPGLKAAVTGAIGAMIADGTLDALAERWVGRDYKMSEATAKPGREVQDAAPPGEASLLARSLPLLERALLMTLFLGFTCFALGAILGLLAALARLSRYRSLRWCAFAYVSVFRGTPLLVQLLLIYFGLPRIGITLGPVPSAVIALTLFSASYLSENFRAGILAVDVGQWEAATTLGMHYWKAMRRIILPQALRISLPPVGSRLVALMKDTSLASTVTVVELTRVADEVGAATFQYLDMFLLVGAVYWASTKF